MKLVLAMALFALSVSCFAQAPSSAEIFTSAQVHDQLSLIAEKAKATGGSGATLGAYGTHTIMVSERTANGGAEIHGHFDDVMIVMAGKATLITGGSLIDAHSGLNGEVSGTGIRDGVSRSVDVGDIVHVPAGTPHQLLITPGTVYSALVIKVKE
jgi:mannose-6-phosphate isomerase-like protein (cupin superfamily)